MIPKETSASDDGHEKQWASSLLTHSTIGEKKTKKKPALGWLCFARHRRPRPLQGGVPASLSCQQRAYSSRCETHGQRYRAWMEMPLDANHRTVFSDHFWAAKGGNC